MVSTEAFPVHTGRPVHVRYPRGAPATYSSPRFPFILPLMLLKRFLLFALLTACPAVANTIIVTGVDSGLGLQQSLYVDENGASTQIYWAGGIDINVDGYMRQVFCVQLFTDIYLDTTYDTVMDYANTPNLQRVSWLLQNEFPGAPLTGANLQVAGAAFQLAIWDIIEDNGDGFATGDGKITQSTDASHPTNPAVLLAAQQYESESLNQTSTYGVVYQNFLNGTPMQNLMGIPVTDGGPSAAPEPTAVILIFSGLAMIAVSRLRRRGNTPR